MYLLFEKKYVEGLSKPLDHPLIAQTKRVLNKYGIDPKDWSVYFTYLTDLLNAKERFSGEELLKRLGAITKSYEIIGANPDVLNEIAYFVDLNVDKAYELLDDEDTALAKFMLKTVWQFRDWVDKDSWKSIAEYFNKTPLYAYVKAYVDILKRKPVLFLAFDEGFGSVAHDISGYNNHGTIYGATWRKLKTGKNALYFDGVDDYVEVPDSASLNVTEFTIIAWVYLNKFGGVVVVKGDKAFTSVGNQSYLLGFRPWVPDWGLRLDWTDETFNWLTQSEALDLNKWHFIAGSYDSNTAYLYWNGQLIKSATFGKTLKTVAYPLYISETTSGLINGLIAHVSIYNRALEQKEIKKIYETTKELFE